MEQMDGTPESKFLEMTTSKKRKGGDVAAIFVHAGAGFHSLANEQVHLDACAKAAQAGMGFLRAGHSALDAVEAAVRVLENNEITNAGYGSNLAIDGTVECDATIVDHYGRSGAVGAMGQVAHPIHVARIVLEGSTQRLSLRRVPPNLLVGQGAVDYAFSNGVPLMHSDFLVSRCARERWKRWRRDLEQANEKAKEYEAAAADNREPKSAASSKPYLEKNAGTDKRLAPLVNESEPLSPIPGSPITSHDNLVAMGTPFTPSKLQPHGHELCVPGQCFLGAPEACAVIIEGVLRLGHNQGHQDGSTKSIATSRPTIPPAWGGLNPGRLINPITPSTKAHNGSAGDSGESGESEPDSPPRALSNLSSRDGSDGESDDVLSLTASEIVSKPAFGEGPDESDHASNADDNITDTVGAIAIDSFGNIAAASSSGGIGMKHRGRTGPAALVGIGTAVHPVHTGDKEKKCVAVVTSGTGEHMATTMAAGQCANRIYWGTKTSSGGHTVETDDEDAIQSFVKEDFMGHPSVKHSNTTAAIGVMSVKKTVDGVWFNFAHNTDSFALASMTSEDNEPNVVMSRITNRNHKVTSGGRSCTWRPSRRDSKEFKRRKRTSLKLGRGSRDSTAESASSNKDPSTTDANWGTEGDPIVL